LAKNAAKFGFLMFFFWWNKERIIPQYGTHIENPLFKRVFGVFRAK